MREPDSLDELPLIKHHYTSGHRNELDDYVDLGSRECLLSSNLPLTSYRVHERYGEPGTGFTTFDPDVAEEYARHGHRVTAVTGGSR